MISYVCCLYLYFLFGKVIIRHVLQNLALKMFYVILIFHSEDEIHKRLFFNFILMFTCYFYLNIYMLLLFFFTIKLSSCLLALPIALALRTSIVVVNWADISKNTKIVHSDIYRMSKSLCCWCCCYCELLLQLLLNLLCLMLKIRQNWTGREQKYNLANKFKFTYLLNDPLQSWLRLCTYAFRSTTQLC